ncbi:hypothetical protein [Pseudofrankia saprophytica]|uniref:hypothetical protein n=1 Tax=Pseudofrankia saprophytica TaxID=298655 RepID=UPI000234B683|nr:hypothetical protein [Pseudofrankia saprophytica]
MFSYASRLLLVVPILALAGAASCGQPTTADSAPADSAPAACDASPPAAADEGATDLRDWSTTVDRAESFRTIRELTAASDAVVRVCATDRTEVVAISGLPFTITDVDVTQTIRGDVPETIRVRQTGAAPGTEVPEPGGDTTVSHVLGEILLRPGTPYFLFLDAFERPGEDTTNQYAVVGVLAGLYREESGQARLLDPESPGLPSVLPIEDLISEVTG